MVELSENMVVYDPSCGSAGFLIMCAKLIRASIKARENGISQELLDERLKTYSQLCLVGTEINERTARVAKLNLLMHGCSYANIFTANALRIEDREDKRLTCLVKENAADVILANPPFAGYEKDPAVLRRFELGRNGHGQASSLTREVLFIEQIIRLLRPGGMAGIVIPQGIFTNRSLARVREYIRQHSQILAIIELPDWAFIPSGTSVRGSLLFIRKLHAPSPHYGIFMKRVEHTGFTSTGRLDDQNDFGATIAEFRRSEPSCMIPLEEVGDRIDAKFYLPEHRATVELFRRNPRVPLVRLCDIGTFDIEKVSPARLGNMTIDLIETNHVDVVNLTVTPKAISARECNYALLKRVRAGDILISRRRAYRGAIVAIPPQLDGALAIPEFSVFRLREGISRDYVIEILRSAEFLKLMTIYSTGEMSARISEKDLTQLQIPLPADQEALGAQFASLRSKVEHLRRLAEEQQAQLARLVRQTINGG